jgi:hypothetical protein
LPYRDDVKVVGLGKNKEKPNFAYLRFLGEPTVTIVNCQYLKYVWLFPSQFFFSATIHYYYFMQEAEEAILDRSQHGLTFSPEKIFR